MNSFFLPHVSGCRSWKSVIASFEQRERYHADYLYPSLGEVVQSLGWVDGVRMFQTLATQANEQAGRFQALQQLISDSEPFLESSIHVFEGLEISQDPTTQAVCSWEPLVSQAVAKAQTYRSILEALHSRFTIYQPLVEWILSAETRHFRDIQEIQGKAPEIWPIREIHMRGRPNLS